MIAEEMVLTITHNGYIKRTSLSTIEARRGKRVQEPLKRRGFCGTPVCSKHTQLHLFFTDKGKYY